MMRSLILILACALVLPAFAQSPQNSWVDMAASDVQHSQLTLPGSSPFHLKAKIVETTNPASSYHATIEEFWVSPEKWKRTIETPGFSQTLIVNGGKVSENNTGDYFPWWLNNMVTAIFTPLPGITIPSGSSPRADKDLLARVSSICTGAQATAGQWNFCFDPRRNLLTSVFNLTTGYGAEFKDFAAFGKKQVPRKITFDPESGTTIEADIAELNELRQPNEQMFAIERPTPPEERITSVRISEDALRKLEITGTVIDWPEVESGKITGGCAVYVSADRSGRMREVWPGGCDNAALEDPLRQIVAKWQLKPLTSGDVPLQVEARLTFTVATKLKPTAAH
jgi:hypothetical protein